ncbi:MAG: CoA transferase [Caulobacteraceae bacterium]|nr:CoA transferase [Caulobacteraceae bacterium]
MRQGPLTGVRIVEFAGIGPGPFCGMLLADMGADLVRIDRDRNAAGGPFARGKRSVILDLKSDAGRSAALALMAAADAVIEPFRPGVMERLGLGPDEVLARNPKIVYGRMTGWGQTGPMAERAGHDINYIGLSGALSAFGPPEKPMQPLNVAGDFGGGSLYLAMGLLAAIIEARASGKGQVVDCAMVDGSASLLTSLFPGAQTGAWGPRGANFLDGGRAWYGVYACAGGGWVSIGPLEPQFYRALLDVMDLDPAAYPQNDPERQPALQQALAERFASKTRDEWCAALEGLDICFGPVLSMTEAPLHPANVARNVFIQVDGVWEPGPAPRFSRTPSAAGPRAEPGGAQADDVLSEWGA